jgi:LAO/AO transport system kinase
MKGAEIKAEVKDLLSERSHEGKITCEEARAIAERLGVPYGEVGRAANLLKIKITQCGLGCF